MKKVVSYAHFRHPNSAYEKILHERGAFFYRYLAGVIYTHPVIYPDWELRIHHDDNLLGGYYGGILLRMQEQGLLRLVYMGKTKSFIGSLLWRLAPLFDADVDRVLCRDLDALQMERERKLVDQWMASGKPVHMMHDHPQHTGMMTGMIGFDAKWFRSTFPELTSPDSLVQKAVKLGIDPEIHPSDQMFLNKYIWPKVKGNELLHRSPPREAVEIKNNVGNPYAIGEPYIVQDVKDIYKARGGPHIETIKNAEGWGCHQVLPRKRAVISSDANVDYYFFLPLTSLFWQRIGYHPTIFLIGTYDEWMKGGRQKLAVTEAAATGADIRFVDHVEGYRGRTCGKAVRLAAAALDVPDDTYLLTSDMDMWPLSRDWFNSQDLEKLALFYANAYDHGQYAMCYIGGKMGVWRKVMGTSGSTVSLELRRILETYRPRAHETTHPFSDEVIFTKVLKASGHYPDICHFIDRKMVFPTARLNRVGWPKVVKVKGMADAHLSRPGYQYWDQMRPVIEQALPGIVDWADQYREKFQRIG